MKVSELTAQLEQETNDAIQQAKEIERNALSKFESDLKQQYSSAANILKNALDVSKTALSTDIATYKTKLTAQLSADSKEMTDQLATLKKEVAKWTPKLVWLVRLGIFLPIAVTLVACGLMILTTWAWMPKELWNIRGSRQVMSDGRSYLVIDDPAWATCNVSKIPKAQVMRPCKTSEWESQLPAK